MSVCLGVWPFYGFFYGFFYGLALIQAREGALQQGEFMADGSSKATVPAVRAPSPHHRWLLDACGIVAVLGVYLLTSLAPAQPPAVDQFGDPLPRGAVARCGTATRLRQASPHAIAVSPDGSRVATRSGDGRLLVWNMTTGALAAPLQPDDSGYAATAYNLAISPDGKLLATQGRSPRSVRLFDLATGKQLTHLGEATPAICLSPSPATANSWPWAVWSGT